MSTLTTHIIKHPISRPQADVGHTYVLECEGKSDGGVTYQWVHKLRDGSFEEVPGEIASTYSVDVTAELIDSVEISCKVNGIYSKAARFQSFGGTAAPSVVREPIGYHFVDGENMTFIAQGGGEGLSYEWFLDDVSVETGVCFSEENVILTVVAASAADEGDYHCVFTNALGSVATRKVPGAIEDGERKLVVGSQYPGTYTSIPGSGNMQKDKVSGYSEGGSYEDMGAITRGWPEGGSINVFHANSTTNQVTLRAFGAQYLLATSLQVEIVGGPTTVLTWNGGTTDYRSNDVVFTEYLNSKHDGLELVLLITDVT